MAITDILRTIGNQGVVAVIRVNDSKELMNICNAMIKGGISGVEITMTTPGAVDAIKDAASKLPSEAIIGAGSVLDAETARLCILAGAQFIVSPITNHEVIKMCKRYSKVCIPGAFTPTEILNAWEAGADVVKVFPANALGPGYFKDLKGPLPQVKLTPTGGIGLSNVGEYIKAGAEFVGAGTSLVDKKLVAEGLWSELSDKAALFVDEVKKARIK